MFVICIVDLRSKKMNGINPGEMAGSLDAGGFQGEYIHINESQPVNNLSIKDVLGDFNKQEILERVKQFELSDDVKYFVNEYERVFNDRNGFIWKWLGPLYKETGVTLSTVNHNFLDSITDKKIILTMLATILDDISDVHQDKELLDAAIDILNNKKLEKKFDNNEKISLISRMWEYLILELSKFPRFKEFKDIFMYDFQQFVNCINYSYLVNNNPNMINIHEMENYDCHNMIVFLLNGIDLMVSPDFDKNDLPKLRNAFWYAQQMARIGNWLSTWKREVKEKDFSSGVFAYAFENNIIDSSEIGKLSDEEIVRRIENSGMKEYFMGVWKENYSKLASLKDKIQSVDMDVYIKGLENVIKFHMASEGMK